MKRVLFCVILAISLVPALHAQEVVEQVIIETPPVAAAPAEVPEPPVVPDAPLPPDTFFFISQEFGQKEELVKDAPYSAEAVTERTQYLSDGNRIYQKTSAKVFRDSQGRTRREHSLGNLGFWVSDEPHHSVFIHDPVAGERYILNEGDRTVHKMKFNGKGPMTFHHMLPPPKPGEAPHPPGAKMMIHKEMAPEGKPFRKGLPAQFTEPKTESMGQKVIEGIQTEGTRTITVIEAGKIGNERPIEIVSEKWYSPELKLNILTKHNDPRFGETVYRLTNLKRTEPDASLFRVPEGYKILEGPGN